MWITRNFTARTLIWLAAIAVPVQSLPAATCGCESNQSCCGNKQSKTCCCLAERVQQGRCCCTTGRGDTAHSCCSKANAEQDSPCKCGLNCQCRKSKQPTPAAPTPEDNTTQKVASNSTSIVSLVSVYQPQVSKRHNDVAFDAGSLAALELCISLCRFTL